MLHELAGAIDRFMRSSPGMPVLLAYIAAAGVPVTLLHELGHALVGVRRLGVPVYVSVGSAGRLLSVRLGRLTLTVNPFAHPARPGGFAELDAGRASARDLMLFALAGPAASLLGFALAAWALSAAPDTGLLHNFLWAATCCGLFGVLNVVPFVLQERRGGRSLRSDGRLALDAARAGRSLR